MPPVPLVSVSLLYLYITLGFQIASRNFYKIFCELERLKSLEFIKKSPFGNRLIVTARCLSHNIVRTFQPAFPTL
ncbi:hypothetical protein BACCAP_00787 [Pseudoflavonifractor capillosus ATCC 29799]|uniref:Uncharacterized protein n=1 Tax=Pseudoflavonifractor capillosus ATCC 29799 TaxID=411467 RepID=A6NRF9_9FIRM|nr:hypothetical protein BACCAP_00787 [Pseudoflavonifractor capillosus ATCC 29799]